MKLSIITTVYNAAADLPRLLDSMIAQKSPELEFFLIDNGSTDNSRAVCEEYVKKDSRFKIFIIKENVGYIRARNIGIKEVHADYIGFCDSDDFLETGAYDRVIQKIKETDCDIYLTSYNTIWDNQAINTKLPYKIGLYRDLDVKEKILPLVFGPYKKQSMLHGFMWKEIFRHELFSQNNLAFDPSLKPYEDQLLNVQIISLCKSVYVDDNDIYNYMVNPQSITAKMAVRPNYKQEWNTIVQLYRSKANYIVNDITKAANANATYFLLYSLILKMVKLEKKPFNWYNLFFDRKIIEKIVREVDLEGNIIATFVIFCLKYHCTRFLFILLKFLLKKSFD